jgi:spore maturation protein B
LNFLVFLSTYILPFFIFYVVAYGLWKGRNVYQAFVEGAKGGFHTALGILPTLVGLLAAVGVLRASGFLDLISGLLKTLLKGTGFPAELLPLVIVRLFSNSAATGLALDLFKAHGPDSTQGLLASLFLSSTETVFYTMSIYFMSVKIKKTRYTLPGALLATLAGIVASVVLVSFIQ